MPKKRDGIEEKKIYSVRIEPRIMEKIIKKYGSFTKFINEKIKKDRGLK